MKHFNSHSIVDIPSEDHITCEESMWKNILYIDTFYPIKDRVSLIQLTIIKCLVYQLIKHFYFQCMVWSWYISLESQFCVVASIILLLAKNHPRYATIICSSFFLSSLVTTTIIRFNKKTKIRYIVVLIELYLKIKPF